MNAALREVVERLNRRAAFAQLREDGCRGRYRSRGPAGRTRGRRRCTEYPPSQRTASSGARRAPVADQRTGADGRSAVAASCRDRGAPTVRYGHRAPAGQAASQRVGPRPTGCSSHQCPPSPAGSVSSAAADARGQRPHVRRRVGRGQRQRRPGAVDPERPQRLALGDQAVRQPGRRPPTASIATCAVTSQVPSGTGATCRPARKPVSVPSTGRVSPQVPVVDRERQTARHRADRGRPRERPGAGRSRAVAGPDGHQRASQSRSAVRPQVRPQPRRRWPGRPAA